VVKIGLISDTHSHLDEAIFKHFENCDEIWHGGDFGTIEIAEKLQSIKKSDGSNILLRGVCGNIDGNDVRSVYPEKLIWSCEEVTVYMRTLAVIQRSMLLELNKT